MNLIFIFLIVFLILKYYFNLEIINKIYFYFKYIVIAILIYLLIRYYNNPQLKKSIINSIHKIDKVPVERGIVELENYWNSLQNLNQKINNNSNHNNNNMNSYNNQTINKNIDNNNYNNIINRHKRNVTNGQKKYVAASQQWKCGHCKQILDASYEVDHILALYKGGTNNLDNLVALCRNCHGNKTMKERLNLI